ncbi:MAG: serine hydrolase [Planctomycetes bacterium]|nr:serine hydrolase [Planctomycetota bacterium]
MRVRTFPHFALALALAACSAPPPPRTPTALPAALGQQIADVVAGLGPTARAAVWFGTADGEALLAWNAETPMPAASAIKAAYLIEAFAAQAGAVPTLTDLPLAPPAGLDTPLPGADAVLADASHPAVAHFSPAQRATAQRLLGGQSTHRVCEAMISSKGVDNATYNVAANLVTARFGGPPALTQRLHARDPRFAGLQVRRYMLADRVATGDNTATAAALAAVHQALARGCVPGMATATVMACRRVLADGLDDEGRVVFRKDGALDSAPATRTRAGWRQGADGTRVFAILLADDRAGAAVGTRLDDAVQRIEALLFVKR